MLAVIAHVHESSVGGRKQGYEKEGRPTHGSMAARASAIALTSQGIASETRAPAAAVIPDRRRCAPSNKQAGVVSLSAVFREKVQCISERTEAGVSRHGVTSVFLSCFLSSHSSSRYPA